MYVCMCACVRVCVKFNLCIQIIIFELHELLKFRNIVNKYIFNS